MNRLLLSLAGLLIFSGAALAQPPVSLSKLTAEEQQLLAPYLTNDFKLTAPLEVRNELKGFGTFFGTIWRIEVDGYWTITRILENKTFLIGKGQLNKDQIFVLAKALVVFDPLTLPSNGLPPLVNPHELSVSFGGKFAFYILGVDQKPAPTKTPPLVTVPVSPVAPYEVGPGFPIKKVVPPLGIFTRFSGLESTVRGLIQPNLGVKFNLPDRLKQLGHP
jgi:hypothetical protein